MDKWTHDLYHYMQKLQNYLCVCFKTATSENLDVHVLTFNASNIEIIALFEYTIHVMILSIVLYILCIMIEIF